MVVARRGDGDAKQVLVFVNGLDDGAQEGEELCVFVRRVAGREEVQAPVRREGPVVVLTDVYKRQAESTPPLRAQSARAPASSRRYFSMSCPA